MKNRSLVFGSLMTVSMLGALIAGATLSLYTSEHTYSNHIRSADFHASLYMTYQEHDILTDEGLIDTKVLDLKKEFGTENYDSEVRGVNLGTYSGFVFQIDELCPTMGGVAKFKLFNLGTIPFDYTVKIVNKLAFTFDETKNYYVQSEAAISDQIQITNNQEGPNRLDSNSSIEFLISYEYLDLEPAINEEAINQKLSFDIQVDTIQTN